MSLRHSIALLVPLALLTSARGDDRDPELVNAEQTLQEAKVETTGDALLRFFRERTLTEAERARLANWVARLGDDDFDAREKAGEDLVRAGRKALPFLRPALRDKDAERARRSALCVEQIESGADLTRVAAAARVLADRKPDGATAALLAYLPGAEDETTEDAILRALLLAGTHGGKPDDALVKALADKEPLRRAAAAHALGRLTDQRAAVRELLADPDARVRFEAAVALLHGRDREAVPVLIGLLADGPLPLGWRAQEFLFRLGGDTAPTGTLSDDEPAKRAAVANTWRAWWQDAGAKIDLAKINLEETLKGINLICEEGPDGGRVWACRADGKPLWQIKGVSTWEAALLPNGHVLIGEYNGSRVTERDQKGKVLWSHAVTSTVSTVQRLPNGNTFISCYNEVLEVDPKGKVVYTYKHPSGGLIARSHRLRNGHLLLAVGGDKIVEVDAKFKEVRTIKVDGKGDSWVSVEPLAGGRYLVAPYGASKAFETDATGKMLWQVDVPQPMSAVRLPNGNTLVSCDRAHAVVEFDRNGKKVWELKTEFSVRCVRRY